MERDVCDRFPPTAAEIAQDRAAEHAWRMRERSTQPVRLVELEFVGGRLQPKGMSGRD